MYQPEPCYSDNQNVCHFCVWPSPWWSQDSSALGLFWKNLFHNWSWQSGELSAQYASHPLGTVRKTLGILSFSLTIARSGINDHCCLGPSQFGVMICPSFKIHLIPQDLKSRDWYLKIEKLQLIFFWYMVVLLIMNFALKINDEYCNVWGILQKCSGGLSLPCKPVDSPHKLIRARQLWLLTSPAGTKDQSSDFWDRLELFCYILFIVNLF